MSVARINYVKHARQTFAKVAKTDEEGNQVVTPVTSKRTGQPKVGRGGRPMVRRIRVSDKERPNPMPKCGKCGTVINVGDPYRWFTVGFRSHWRQVRCMKSECTPRESERESSGIRSGILAAMEAARDDLAGLTSETDSSDVESIVQTVGEALREAADQWREADEQFGGGGMTENGERADSAESGADELESWSYNGESEPDYESCDDEVHLPREERSDEEDDREGLDRGDAECDSCSQIRESWFEDLMSEANDALDNVEIP